MPAQNYNRSTATPIENLPVSIEGVTINQNSKVSIRIKGNGNNNKGTLMIELDVDGDLTQLDQVKDMLTNYGV